MTCPESEALMGEGEISTALEEHLTGCAGCRTLWDDLEANRHVLRAMGLEVLPTAPESGKGTRSSPSTERRSAASTTFTACSCGSHRAPTSESALCATASAWRSRRASTRRQSSRDQCPVKNGRIISGARPTVYRADGSPICQKARRDFRSEVPPVLLFSAQDS